MTLSREQILKARGSRKPHREDVPEWGGDVLIKVLSVEEQAELSRIAKQEAESGTVPCRVLLMCLVDEDGDLLFSEKDLGELMREDFPVIARVFGVAAKLNGLTNEELEEAIASFGQSQSDV